MSIRRFATRGLVAAPVLLTLLAGANFVAMALDVTPPAQGTAYARPDFDPGRFDTSCGWLERRSDWLFDLVPGAPLDAEERINADGLRGPRVPLAKGTRLRIGVLGEGAAFGVGVREAECWPRQLEALLRNRGVDAEVVNFSLPGQSTPQAALRWLRKLHAWSPDVLLLQLSHHADGLPAPSRIGDVDRMMLDQGALARSTIDLRRVGLVRLTRRLLQIDDVKPGAAFNERRAGVGDVTKGLNAIAATTRARGIKLACVVGPHRSDVLVIARAQPHYEQAVRRFAHLAKVPVLDVGGAMRDAIAAGVVVEPEVPERSVLFRGTFEPSAVGHEWIARLVARELDGLGWLRR